VIPNECAPGPGGRTGPLDHVPGDGRLDDLVARLWQLAMDAGRSPAGSADGIRLDDNQIPSPVAADPGHRRTHRARSAVRSRDCLDGGLRPLKRSLDISHSMPVKSPRPAAPGGVAARTRVSSASRPSFSSTAGGSTDRRRRGCV
jgi:hypothetical protein